jgi:membrane protein YdbS with pleckstrin-like domain
MVDGTMFNRDNNYNPDERLVFETRPRFLANMKGTIVKFIILLMVFYFFRDVMLMAVSLETYSVQYIQLPIIQATYYLLLLIIILLIISMGMDLLSWRQKKYKITTQRVVVKRGKLRKKRSYIHYNKIQDIDVDQGILDRLFSAGDIKIYGGHEYTNIVLEDVPNPKEVEEIIDRLTVGENLDLKPENPQISKRSIIEEYDQKFKR